MSDKQSVPAAERQENFLKVFRHFKNAKEAAQWIGEVTLTSPSTVYVWRCKGETAYGIPERPYKMLMDAVAQRFPS